MSQTCEKCGAECCTYFCFEIDEPDSCEEFEDVRWYLYHEGVTVHVDDGDWYISIENRCKNLTGNGLCLIYEERPLICRGYSLENCDFTGADYGYDEFFETPGQIMAYARKTLGAATFDAERKKTRAKLEVESAKSAKTKRKR